MGSSGKVRCCQFLNNTVEQDHRRVEFRVQPMLGLRPSTTRDEFGLTYSLLQQSLAGPRT
jgi:transposase-like protein